MSTPERIIEDARQCGSRRSAEYWRGALDALRFRLCAAPIACPYPEGSVQFDAYFAGNERGHALWRDQQSSAFQVGAA